MGIELKLLGPVQVRNGGHDTTPNSRIQRMVLAALILQPNRVVTVRRLAGLLWEVEPASYHANLRTHVSAVRRAASPAGENRLMRHLGGYRLVVRPGESDVDEFWRLCTTGRSLMAGGDSADGVDVLGRAVALWRGSAGGCLGAHGQLADHLTALDLERVSVFEEWVDARLRRGEASGLLGMLRAHLAENPTREHAWGQLMRAAYHAGDAAAALSAFGEVRRLLAEQLGIEPGRPLLALHRAILARDEEELRRPYAASGMPVAASAA